MTVQTTRTSRQSSNAFGVSREIPGILVAFAPTDACTVDRCRVASYFCVGRSSGSDLPIRDDKISKNHFRIVCEETGFWIEDTGSTNGTYVDGKLLRARNQLQGGDVIRVGRAVLVFQEDAGDVFEATPLNRYGMAGNFHTGPLVEELRRASVSNRHALLTGPSGTGKELAANALAEIGGRNGKPLPFLAHNAARFSSEEEATATLFGVGPRMFSNVDARAGLIEQADGGALFIDEVHNLPQRVQRSLLRVIEDGRVSRFGETNTRQVDVRFILASNSSAPACGLAPDLFARLRRVRIPPLSERVADIPAIMDAVLVEMLERHGLGAEAERVLGLLGGDHYEALCLDGFRTDNVRGLVDLADRVVTHIATGTEPTEAISRTFGAQFGTGQVAMRTLASEVPMEEPAGSSHYEKHREMIVAAYRKCEGNLSATERLLKSRGFNCSRRWLSVFLEKWGER